MKVRYWHTTLACALATTLAVAEPSDSKAAKDSGSYRSANQMIGMNIQNAAEESIGSVVDIVLDSNQNRVAYVIVSYGGFLGLGAKHFAVPWQAFNAKGDDLLLNIERDRLENAPGFDQGNLPNQADPMFHQSVHTFYGVRPYAIGNEQAESALREDQESADNADSLDSYDWLSWTAREDTDDWARKLGDVIGISIQNPQEETIAELEDVIIDTQHARAAYAIVSYGGMLGFYSDTAAVPWSALQLDKAEEVFVLDATAEELAAVKLSPTEYQALEDENFARAIRRPFDPDNTDQTESAAEGGGNGDSDAVVLYGTVMSVGSYNAIVDAGNAQQNVRLRIRTTAGDHRTVHLGSRNEIQAQELSLANGDRIIVTGKTTDYRGQRVVKATSISKNGEKYDVHSSADAIGKTK